MISSSNNDRPSKLFDWETSKPQAPTHLTPPTLGLQILAADSSGCLSIFSLSRGRLVATSRLTPERGPIISFSSVLSRQLYAVVVERRLTVVRVEHQLDYNTARGGHEGAVVGMYSCSGGLVSLLHTPQT